MCIRYSYVGSFGLVSAVGSGQHERRRYQRARASAPAQEQLHHVRIVFGVVHRAVGYASKGLVLQFKRRRRQVYQ